MTFSVMPPVTHGASDSDIDMWWAISSGSKSHTVEPSSTFPCLVMAPVAKSRASARVVLPAPLWPTRATLRIPLGPAAAPA